MDLYFVLFGVKEELKHPIMFSVEIMVKVLNKMINEGVIVCNSNKFSFSTKKARMD